MNSQSPVPSAAVGSGTVGGGLGTPSGTAPPSQPPVGAMLVDSGGLTGVVSSISADPPGNSAFSKVLPPRQAHHVPLEFTGAGGEYFRIWIVNLLLVFVTLGIYLPWAKVRKLRYFYNNTQIGGHALDFHGEPRKMLRGTALAGGLFMVYSFATQFSPVAGLVAILALVALWPVLLRSALQFRLGHTSWRGLRFSFTGDTAGAYKAVVVPMLLLAVPLALVSMIEEQPEAAELVDSAVLGWALLACLGAGMLTLPYYLWRLKKYQHDHFRLGQLQTELRLGPWPVYGVCLRTIGVVVAPVLLIGAGIALSAGLSAMGVEVMSAVFALFALLFVLSMLYMNLLVGPYLTVRMQNLIWTKTGNRYLRFRSELKLASYFGLQVKNWLLLMLTLGLYWPWAAVANRRMRLEAVTLVSRVDLDELIMALRPRTGDAAADMGDELLGFDIGL